MVIYAMFIVGLYLALVVMTTGSVSVGVGFGLRRPLRFLRDRLLAGYGREPGEDLGRTLEMAYRRVALVDVQRGERLTCDFDLAFAGADGRGGQLADGAVILERRVPRSPSARRPRRPPRCRGSTWGRPPPVGPRGERLGPLRAVQVADAQRARLRDRARPGPLREPYPLRRGDAERALPRRLPSSGSRLDRRRVALDAPATLLEWTFDFQAARKGMFFRLPVTRRAVLFEDPERGELSR